MYPRYIPAAVLGAACLLTPLSTFLSSTSLPTTASSKRVDLEVFVPRSGDVAGVGGRGWLVDLVAHFKGDLASTGASPELTGPAAHANTPPFPGTFSPGADADHFPGLVVLLTSTNIGAGPGQNAANLFNLISITNRKGSEETDVWATWIIGAPSAFGVVGQKIASELFVAVVAGTAPNVVADMNADGELDEEDLELMGFEVISNTKEVKFVVNGN